MRKQTWNRFLVMAVSILLVCAACFAASAENAGNSDFEINGTTLVKYHGNGGEVTVPDGIEVLGEEAFQSTGVTKVNLPESLKTIESHCFLFCTGLEEITLPASLEGLEDVIQPFGYSGLKEFKTAEGGNYKAVDGVLFTADGKTLVCYPSEKDDVIYAIPEGTERLGRSPFDGFQAISLYIPSTLTDMETGFNIFEGSSNLQEFNVSPDNKKFYSKGGALYTGNRLIAYPAQKYWNKLKPTDFPAGLKEIGPDAFCSNDDVESVELPEGVEVVGTAAFYGMKSLKTVVVPASVKDIDPMAFVRCENLERVTVLNPDVNVQGYADYDPKGYNILRWNDTTNAVLCGYAGGNLQAYAEKCGLKFETLDPETGKVIETAAETATAAPEDNSDFEINGTTLVKYKGPGGEVTVPDGIETLGEWAFSGSGVTKVHLPESLKTIENHCFFGCNRLTEITLPASLEGLENVIQPFSFSGLKEFKTAEGGNYKAVDGVLFTADGKTLVYYPSEKKDWEYSIPEGTERLGWSSFDRFQAGVLNIPSTLTGMDMRYNMFTASSRLQSINVSPDNDKYYSVDGALYAGNRLIAYPSRKNWNKVKPTDFPAGLKEINSYAFMGNCYVESVELPEGVEVVGDLAFQGMNRLKTVVLPASVKKIGYLAFEDCDKLERVTVLNPDVNVEGYADYDPKLYNLFCRNNTTNAVLCGYAGGKLQAYAEKCGLNFEALDPETEEAAATAAETVAETAAATAQPAPAAEEKPAEYNSEEFTIEGTTLVKYKGPGGEVTVPEGVEVLGEEAFQSTGVTKVHLPESLKTIESHCFFGCSRLTEITLPASLEGLEWETQPFGYSGLREFKTAEGSNYKAVDGVLFTADGKTLVCYPPAKADREYTIPEGTESLGQSPFDELRAETVNIPSTLTDMGMEYNVFVGSYNLRNINVSPENKKYYSVDGVLYTGNRLVYYPTQQEKKELKPEDFPAGLKEIGDDSFWGNDYLVNVELPKGLETVGGKAFHGMANLKTLLVPASVKEIGFLTFASCRNLERVTILNPDVDVLEGYGNSDPKLYNLLCWDDTTNAVLCGYPGGKLQAYAEKCGLKFETLDPEAEKAAETAQFGPAATEKPLEYDRAEFTVEGTTLVKYKGPGGEVTVPDGIETLGEWAFSGSGVTKVNLPESLKTIDYYCFHSCDTLEEITIPASVVDIMETQAFAYNTNLKAIHVAEGNPCYTSVDGVLFTGNGQKLLYYPAGKNRGGKYAIPEGTVSLGRTAFEGTGLTAVTLPSSLVTLEGGNDFSSNYELEEIRVAEGNPRFRSIDGMLFDQAGKLLCYPAGRKTEIMGANDFPAEMTAIGPWAFQYVQHLRSITVPNGIKTINWMCFTWAKSLESVILPASVDYIAGYAFADCPELRQVVILNPDAYIVLDDERFSDDYRAKMNFNIVDESPKAVLYGYEGSTAQEYAGLRDDTFVSLGQGPARNTDAAAEPGERQAVPGCAQ